MRWNISENLRMLRCLWVACVDPRGGASGDENKQFVPAVHPTATTMVGQPIGVVPGVWGLEVP